MRYRAHLIGFTLIELLVVISIIALLIALLLPTLGQAQESAKTILCAANQKQMALGVVVYANDNDGVLPAGIMFVESPRSLYWPGRILPYVQDEKIFVCSKVLSGFRDWNAYMANGGPYMFYYAGQGQPQHIDSIKAPSRTFMFRESTEDWADEQKGRTWMPGAGGSLLNGNLTIKMEYFDNPNSHHKSAGGRHFRGAGNANNDPWGFDNITFMDGHVNSYSMQQLVEQSTPNAFWFEYPHVPAAATSAGAPYPNTSAPQPGAEWWGPPYWQ